MALEPKFADVPMTFGIDEDVDPASDPGGMLVLENAEYTKEGAIRARPGFRRSVVLPGGVKVRGLIQADGALGVVTTDKIIAVSPGSNSYSLPETSSIGETKTLFLGSTGQNVVSVDSHRKIVNGVDYTFVAMAVLDQTDPEAVIDIYVPPSDQVINPIPKPKSKERTVVATFQLRESLTGTVVREGRLSEIPSEYCVRVVNWTNGWVVLVADEEAQPLVSRLVSYHIPGATGNITREIVAMSLGNLGWGDDPPLGDLQQVGCPYDAVFDQNPIVSGGAAFDKIYIVVKHFAGDTNIDIVRYIPGVSADVIPIGNVARDRLVCSATLCVATYDDGPRIFLAFYGGTLAVSVAVYNIYTGGKVVINVPNHLSDDPDEAMQGPLVITMQQFSHGEDVILAYGLSFGALGSINSAHGTRLAKIHQSGGGASVLDTKFWTGVFPTTKLAVRPLFTDGRDPGMFMGIRDFYSNKSQYTSTQLVQVTDGFSNLFDHPRPQGMLLHQEESWPFVNFIRETRNGLTDWWEDLEGNDLPGEMILPNLQPFGDGFTVTMPTFFESTKDGNKILKRYRTVEAAMDPEIRKPVVFAQLAGSATVAGSMPVTWDGTGTSTAGWLRAPTTPVLGTVPTEEVFEVPGPDDPTYPGHHKGKYSYIQILEHIDHNGTIVRSPPSPISSITLTPPTVQDDPNSKKWITVLLTMPEPMLTPLVSDGSGFRLKVYRTKADGADYRLVLNTAIYPGREPATWIDRVSDTNWATGEPPYSLPPTIAEASADPVPSFVHVAVHRNRMIGVRADSREIRYSKEIPDDSGRPEWPDSFGIRVDNDAGPVTAVASLSDLLVVFQEHAVCIIDGPGPDNTGEPLNAFTVPQKVNTGYGVSLADNASVVTTPIGVLFRHVTGIKLMTRPTEIADIGDAVRDQVKQMGRVSGAYMPSRRQAWFYGTADSRILVLDVDRLRWSVWKPNLAGGFLRGMVEAGGVQYVVTDLAVWKIDEIPFSDVWSGSGKAYTVVLDIPWFRGAGQAGMQRVWDLAISGTSYGNVPVFDVEVFTQQAHSPPKHPEGVDATYHFSNHVPNQTRQFILTLRPRVQRCTAMRLRITMKSYNNSTPDVAGTRVPDISNIRYHFGVVTPQGRAPTFPTIT